MESRRTFSPTELFHRPPPGEEEETLELLRHLIQTAIRVEFTTIPAYSTAMYSMKDRACDAYRLTMGIAMEEMYHVYQASNLLIAVGGEPRFTRFPRHPKPAETPEYFAPSYPVFLPDGDPQSNFAVTLGAASEALYREVFMRIEKPAPRQSPGSDATLESIGQFYALIEAMMERLEGEAAERGGTIFHDTPGYAQHDDYYFGKGAGRIVSVSCLDDAKRAIRQIVDQGEGAEPPARSIIPDQAYGNYNHYGHRLDGHYGPAVDSRRDLNHYFKFKLIAEGVMALPEVYPILEAGVAVPEAMRHPDAVLFDGVFNGLYSVMLRALEASFREGGEARRFYFEAVTPIMHAHLPRLAEALMNTPAWRDGNLNTGPNAAPTWRYLDTPMAELIGGLERALDELGARAEQGDPRVRARDEAALRTLRELLAHYRLIAEGAAAHGFDLD